jgi:hypothetical protein
MSDEVSIAIDQAIVFPDIKDIGVVETSTSLLRSLPDISTMEEHHGLEVLIPDKDSQFRWYVNMVCILFQNMELVQNRSCRRAKMHQ